MDKYHFAKCYIILGIIYDGGFSRFNESLTAYTNGVEIILGNTPVDQRGLAIAYANIGLLHRKLGDLAKAESHYIYAINIFEKLDDPINATSLGQAYNNIGFATFALGKFHESLNYYFKSLDIKKSKDNDGWEIYQNIADCYIALENNKDAEQYYQIAFDDYFSKTPNDSIGPANLNIGYGNFLLKENKLDKALPYIKNAYDLYIVQFGPKHRLTSQSLEKLGDYYIYFDVNKSLTYYHDAIISTVNNFSNKSVFSNPDLSDIIDKEQLIASLKSKTEALDSLYKQTNNIEVLKFVFETRELLIKLANEVRIGFQYEESKLFLSEEESKL